jgi:hypothetical protein
MGQSGKQITVRAAVLGDGRRTSLHERDACAMLDRRDAGDIKGRVFTRGLFTAVSTVVKKAIASNHNWLPELVNPFTHFLRHTLRRTPSLFLVPTWGLRTALEPIAVRRSRETALSRPDSVVYRCPSCGFLESLSLGDGALKK